MDAREHGKQCPVCGTTMDPVAVHWQTRWGTACTARCAEELVASRRPAA
jgi:hypothetical protein